MDDRLGKGPSLKLDRARFEAVERLAVYEMVNTLLLDHLELQRVFDLRAEEFQVFFLIAVTTAQRHVRGAGGTPVGALLDRTPLGPEQSGSISRRRIAETLDIPLETVRRHVAHLMAKGLVVERGRGRIATPGGTLARVSAADATLHLMRRQLTLTNTLLRLGVLIDGRTPEGKGLPPAGAGD